MATHEGKPSCSGVIVMYHYVRPLSRTRFPRLSGLDVDRFRRQVKHLSRNHTFIRQQDLVDAFAGKAELPPAPCLLTFDDGYSDHFGYVAPILDELGVPGVFFPPRSAMLRTAVLDVNKVQFLLASGCEAGHLAAEIERYYLANGGTTEEVGSLRSRLAHANRWDPAEVIYVKRLLQHALPSEVRAEICRRLFQKYVSADEAAFAEELYLSVEQARMMWRAGFEFGGHGDRHLWHGLSDPSEQAAEIGGARDLLRMIADDGERGLAYCFPFGSHDEQTISLLKDSGFCLAFGTKSERFSPVESDRFNLPRIDTNDAEGMTLL